MCIYVIIPLVKYQQTHSATRCFYYWFLNVFDFIHFFIFLSSFPSGFENFEQLLSGAHWMVRWYLLIFSCFCFMSVWHIQNCSLHGIICAWTVTNYRRINVHSWVIGWLNTVQHGGSLDLYFWHTGRYQTVFSVALWWFGVVNMPHLHYFRRHMAQTKNSSHIYT